MRGVSGCKPMAKVRIYLLSTRRRDISPADLNNGWQGSGIFAISPACHRSRRIAASRWTLHQPSQLIHALEVPYVNRFRQAVRDGARIKVTYQYFAGQPEGLR